MILGRADSKQLAWVCFLVHGVDARVVAPHYICTNHTENYNNDEFNDDVINELIYSTAAFATTNPDDIVWVFALDHFPDLLVKVISRPGPHGDVDACWHDRFHGF